MDYGVKRASAAAGASKKLRLLELRAPSGVPGMIHKGDKLQRLRGLLLHGCCEHLQGGASHHEEGDVMGMPESLELAVWTMIRCSPTEPGG